MHSHTDFTQGRNSSKEILVSRGKEEISLMYVDMCPLTLTLLGTSVRIQYPSWPLSLQQEKITLAPVLLTVDLVKT